jgi:hypothetical protein
MSAVWLYCDFVWIANEELKINRKSEMNRIIYRPSAADLPCYIGTAVNLSSCQLSSTRYSRSTK